MCKISLLWHSLPSVASNTRRTTQVKNISQLLARGERAWLTHVAIIVMWKWQERGKGSWGNMKEQMLFSSFCWRSGILRRLSVIKNAHFCNKVGTYTLKSLGGILWCVEFSCVLVLACIVFMIWYDRYVQGVKFDTAPLMLIYQAGS